MESAEWEDINRLQLLGHVLLLSGTIRLGRLVANARDTSHIDDWWGVTQCQERRQRMTSTPPLAGKLDNAACHDDGRQATRRLFLDALEQSGVSDRAAVELRATLELLITP